MTIKQVRFVKAGSRNPVQDIAELAVFDASGNPVDPPTSLADGSGTTTKLADNATKEKAGLVKQAAHVNDPAGETPTKAEFIALRNALVTAGLMASA